MSKPTVKRYSPKQMAAILLVDHLSGPANFSAAEMGEVFGHKVTDLQRSRAAEQVIKLITPLRKRCEAIVAKAAAKEKSED